MLRARGAAFALLFVLLAFPAPPAEAQDAPSVPTHRRWFPEGSVYAPYLAEISRPGFGLTVIGVPDNGVAEAGDLRFGLKLGGRFGLLRVGPPAGRDGRVWQLDLAAGFYGQFDIEHSLDNIGWDGLYGLVLSSAPSAPGGTAVRVGVQHWSSHVGDEYAERTGRRRIGYTREEIMVGAAWPGLLREGGWRVYVEGGYGYSGNAEDEAGNRIQQPGRAQAGVEHEAPGVLGEGGRWGWYTAFDAVAYEERDWTPDLALGAGFLVEARERRWRAGITLYDGRTPIGEFFRSDERYAVLGLWLDLERGPSALR